MLEIKKGQNSFYIGDSEDNVTAEITYKVDGDTFIVEHTYVSPELRGQGVAAKLLDKLLNYVRSNNIKIIPICPYVFSMFEKHPEWHDLLK
ncbi:MAG: GNAT family N-acetyltransferase [Bacilli bacterium]|nr:N-acetyltransferase [Bacilli bacterium]